MPVPPNTDITTATVIPSLNYSTTQSGIHDAGTTYEVWYQFTATEEVVMNVNIRGAGAYTPAIWLYIDDFAGALGIISANLMTQIPLIIGRTYFFRIIPNGGNPNPATVTIELQKFVGTGRAVGDIFIRAASILPSFLSEGYTGLAAATISPSTGTIKDLYPQFRTGESGDYLPVTGELLFADEYNGPPYDKFRIFNAGDLSQRAVVVYDWSGSYPIIRTSREQGVFYVGDRGNAGVPKTTGFFTITKDGVMSAETLMGGFGMTAIANSADNLYVYTAGQGSSVGAAIKKWDKAGAAYGADFAAGVANHIVQDILVMADGKVIALYHEAATDSIFVRVYSAAGATLLTYTAPAVAYTSIAPRLGYANDASISFWLFLHQSDGFNRFINVKVSDVSVLANVTCPSSDYFGADQGATPAYRFVASDSCPFTLLLAASGPGYGGIYVITTNKRTDVDGASTVAIPAPTFKTALMP